MSARRDTISAAEDSLEFGDIMELLDKWDQEFPMYTYVVNSPHNAAILKIEAEDKGIVVRVRKPDTFNAALKFVRQL